MRERGREVRGVSGASRRKQEVAREAGGGRGLSGARHASPLPTGRGRRQGGGSGDGLGRAGPGKWAPGNFLLSLFYFFSISVILFLI